MPASSASRASASAASSLRWFSRQREVVAVGEMRPARVLWGVVGALALAARSQPPASGLQGITPIP